MPVAWSKFQNRMSTRPVLVERHVPIVVDINPAGLQSATWRANPILRRHTALRLFMPTALLAGEKERSETGTAKTRMGRPLILSQQSRYPTSNTSAAPHGRSRREGPRQVLARLAHRDHGQLRRLRTPRLIKKVIHTYCDQLTRVGCVAMAAACSLTRLTGKP
jgi:hypothetical protein